MVDVDRMRADLLVARKTSDKTTEVPRLELAPEDHVRIIQTELADAAAQLRAGSAVLVRYLDASAHVELPART